MNWCIYARVSERGSNWHEQGIESSIATQIDAGRKWIAAHDQGGKVARVVEDEFESGGSLNRPGLDQVLAELDTASWDSLWVVDWDRVSRSMDDSLELLKRFQASGKGLVAAAQNWDYSTAIGRLSLHVSIAFAEYFRRKISLDTKRKMLSIAEHGGWPAGMVAFGYRRAGKHDNRLVVEPREAETVRALFRRYAAGEPIGSIRNDLFPKRGMTSVWYILKNKVYTGRVHYAGVDAKGSWEPIVSEAEFAAVADRLPKWGTGPRPGLRRYHYLLMGLVRHHCGRAMSGTSGQGRNKQKWYYYRCQKCRKYLRADALEEAVLHDLRGMAVNPQQIAAVAAELQAREDAARAKALPELAQVERAIVAAKKEQRAIDKALLSGLLTKRNAAQWNERADHAREELERLDKRRAELSAVVDDRFAKYGSAEEIAKAWADVPAQLRLLKHDPTGLERYVRTRVRSVTVREDESLELEYWNGSSVRAGKQSGYPNCMLANLRHKSAPVGNGTHHSAERQRKRAESPLGGKA